MSANTVARWNAIPMSHPNSESSQQNNLKRSRPDDDEDDAIQVDEDPDDDDDDVSILSRSPSPPTADAMDVDKYDEYIKGVAREVITVETKLKPDNKGFSMLAKLGWSEGQPLGLSSDGRVDPVPFQIKRDLTGLGKINQELRMIEAAVSQRRGLDSERQQKETEDQRQAREDNVARRAALQTEISSTLKAFYCALCDKQFKTVAQYDEHTNSYAHHHKARFKDMQSSLKAQGDADKRKEKERKREEKELRKIAAAAGVRMAKPTVPITPAAPSSTDPVSANTSVDAETTSTGFKKSGWATLGGGSSSSDRSVPEPPTVEPGSWATTPSPTRSIPGPSHAAPSFRSASWASLDTGSIQPVAPPPEIPPPPPVPAMQSRVGWSPAGASRPRGRWNVVAGPSASGEGGQPPSAAPSEYQTHFGSSGRRLAPGSLPRPPSPQTDPPPPPPVRSGWQQFKQTGPKRR